MTRVRGEPYVKRGSWYALSKNFFKGTGPISQRGDSYRLYTPFMACSMQLPWRTLQQRQPHMTGRDGITPIWRYGSRWFERSKTCCQLQSLDQRMHIPNPNLNPKPTKRWKPQEHGLRVMGYGSFVVTFSQPHRR